MSLTPAELNRLRELLADEWFDQLAPEDRAELAELRARGREDEAAFAALQADVVRFVDACAGPDVPQAKGLPTDLRAKLIDQGRRVTGGAQVPSATIPIASAPGRGGAGGRMWLALAASIAILGLGSWISYSMIEDRNRRLAESLDALKQSEIQLAQLTERVASNEVLLASSRKAAEELQQRLADAGSVADEQKRLLADAAKRELELGEELARATSDLDKARLAIAEYQTPVDPATLAQNRTKLLEVPGTIRLAWQPFDLPDNPAEQRQVQGDVIWNDQTQQGYLRFVGLKVNDPAVEQYQVWIIDERGLEQKVGGGVFNATAQGEVIVPIKPGIDVGRVALFAITVEKPGGTWVPDLKRRVVVAPREG